MYLGLFDRYKTVLVGYSSPEAPTTGPEVKIERWTGSAYVKVTDTSGDGYVDMTGSLPEWKYEFYISGSANYSPYKVTIKAEFGGVIVYEYHHFDVVASGASQSSVDSVQSTVDTINTRTLSIKTDTTNTYVLAQSIKADTTNMPVDVDTRLSSTHGSGVWDATGGSDITPQDIDTYLSSIHGSGSWEGGAEVMATLQEIQSSLSGLSTLEQTNEVLLRLKNAEDFLKHNMETVEGASLIDNFSNSWASDSTSISSVIDTAQFLHGGSSNKIFITLADSTNHYIYKNMADGKEIDFSPYDSINVWVRSEGAGAFLAIEMSADNVTFHSFPITILDEDLLAWGKYTINITSITDRTKMKYFRFKVINTDVDVSTFEGVQIWHQYGVQAINVWIDRFEAVSSAGTMQEVLETVSGNVVDVSNEIDVLKSNVSGLVTKEESKELLMKLLDTEYFARSVFESLGNRTFVENFNVPWASTDTTAFISTLDTARYICGGSSNRIFVDIVNSVGDYIYKTLPDGEELDFSSCESMQLYMMAEGAGQFLRLSFSEDNTDWNNFDITILDVDINKWKKYTFDISDIVSKSAVKYFKFTMMNNDVDISVIQGVQLWNNYNINTINIWLDKLEAVSTNATIIPPGNWT